MIFLLVVTFFSQAVLSSRLSGLPQQPNYRCHLMLMESIIRDQRDVDNQKVSSANVREKSKAMQGCTVDRPIIVNNLVTSTLQFQSSTE